MDCSKWNKDLIINTHLNISLLVYYKKFYDRHIYKSKMQIKLINAILKQSNLYLLGTQRAI